MVQSLDPCDPDVWSGFLVGVSTGVQQSITCGVNLKQGPKGRSNLGGSGGMVPLENYEI